jgi:hypothetical protein
MRFLIIAMVAVCLAGCASTTDLRSGSRGEKDLDKMTDKAVQQVAGCIGDKLDAWKNTNVAGHGNDTLSTRPTATGFTVSLMAAVSTLYGSANGTDTVVLADISQVEKQTHVELWTHFIGHDTLITPLVQACL